MQIFKCMPPIIGGNSMKAETASALFADAFPVLNVIAGT